MRLQNRTRMAGGLVLAAAGAGAVVLVLHLNVWGTPKADTGAVNAGCLRMIRDFEDYPVLFPGESAFGLPLTFCDRYRRAARFDSVGRMIVPESDTLALIYGTCEPSPDAGCPPPVQVILESPCSAAILDESQRVEEVQVRGVDAIVKRDGSVRIETPQFRVSLFVLVDPAGGAAAQRDKALALARLLRGGNALAAAVGPDSGLNVPIGKGKACE